MRRLAIAMAAMIALAGVRPADAGLYQPETVGFLAELPIKACGIRADYNVTGSALRVEILIIRTGAAFDVLARAYSPNSVGPILRDIWLRSPTFLSLGKFRPARENKNGIRETRGQLALKEGMEFASELAQGGVEISLIFDGAMPAARLPLGLPAPLPIVVAGELESCLGMS